MPTAAPAARRSGFLASHFGGLPRSFWLLFSGQLVSRVGGMVVPFLVFLLTHKGISTAEAGLIISAVGFGDLIGQPTGGYLADRVSRRLTVLLGLYGTSIFLALLGIATGFPALFGICTFLGMATAVPRPAISALVSDFVEPEHRARAFGLIYWAMNLGVALAGVTSTLLISVGFWLLIAVDSLSSTAFAFIIHLGLPPDRRMRIAPTESGSGYGVIFRDKLLITLVLLVVVNCTIMEQSMFGLPLAIRDDHLPLSLFGLLFTLNGVLIGLLQPSMSTWLSRFSRMRVLAASWTVLSFGMALTGLAGFSWEYAATVTLWTLGEIGAASVLFALVADLAPAGAEGRYQAALGWSMATSRFIAPLLAGFIYTDFSPAALWGGCAVFGVAGGIGGLLLAPAVRRRQADGT